MSGKYDDIIDLCIPSRRRIRGCPCATARRSSRPLRRSPVTAPPLRRRSAAPPTRRSRRTSGSQSRSLRRRACIQGRSMFGRRGGNTGAIAPRQNVRRRSSHPAASSLFCTKPRSSEQPHRQTADAAIRQAKRRKSNVSGMGRSALKILL